MVHSPNPLASSIANGCGKKNFYAYETRNLPRIIKTVISWHSDLDGKNAQSFVNFLISTIIRFGRNTEFENDERVLPIYRLLAEYSTTLSARSLLYSRLHGEGLYRTSAVFYRDWAEALLRDGSIPDALQVLKDARKCGAEPAKLIDNMEQLVATSSSELRHRVLVEITDLSKNVNDVRQIGAKSGKRYTDSFLYYVLSTTKMSEVLLYMGAAVAPPTALPFISERLCQVRQLTWELARNRMMNTDDLNAGEKIPTLIENDENCAPLRG